MEDKTNNKVQDVEFYKQAYEQEKLRAASLAGRLADAKNEADSLQFQLDRIKNNPMWKASKPLRQVMHWGLRNYRRVRNLGGPRGIARKLRQKKSKHRPKNFTEQQAFQPQNRQSDKKIRNLTIWLR